jgi:hypothetical protein
MLQRFVDSAAIAAEIERVRSLSGGALRRRWQSVFGRSPPEHLTPRRGGDRARGRYRRCLSCLVMIDTVQVSGKPTEQLFPDGLVPVGATHAFGSEICMGPTSSWAEHLPVWARFDFGQTNLSGYSDVWTRAQTPWKCWLGLETGGSTNGTVTEASVG